MRLNQPLWWGFLFATAMGALEAIVVVYLRQLYYPDGFDFPLEPMDQSAISIEWLREAATLVMLAAAGILAGTRPVGRFGWFLFLFAVWDIWYYVWLKVLLGWPGSLLTWDILFLIPIPWVGPVLAPVICSVSMIALGLRLIRTSVTISKNDWVWLGAGTLIVLESFMHDFLVLLSPLTAVELKDWDALMRVTSEYVPVAFPWIPFSVGMILIWIPTLRILRRPATYLV